jgi:hypothetical protein
VTRPGTKRITTAALLVTLAGPGALAARAQAGPPLAPPPPVAGPSALDLAIDVALPTLASYVALRYVIAGLPTGADPTTGLASPGTGYLASGILLAGLAAPPVALVAYRERPFALDMALAAFAGGLLGAGVGYGGARLAGAGTPSPDLLALAMAVGQGLGTATAYHLYRTTKATATDLDRLPADRKDDPIDDWKIQRERRNP